MKDDNDLLREGLLPSDPFADADPIEEASDEAPPLAAEYRPFPIEALPEPVLSFVVEASNAIGCDPAFIALSALAGLAGAVGNTRRIKLKESWCEPSILWIATIGDSGTHKSPALDTALAPLRRIQAKAIAEYFGEKKLYDDEMERLRRSRKRSQLMPETPPSDPPVPWRILCSDITVEALAGILDYSPRGLILVRDELSGWIKSFDQYKKAQGADAAHFLSMHRAGDVLIDRKTNSQIIHVRRAALCVAGGIQLKVLKRTLGEEHLDNGLAARLLLAMPPKKPKRWTDAEISPETMRQYSELFESLLRLEFVPDEMGSKGSLDLPLTESGKEAWIRFFNLHGIEQARREGDLAAAYSKLEGYCARFALLVHLIRCQGWDQTPETEGGIDARSVRAGVTLTKWFAYETERVYDALDIAPASTSPSDLEEIIRRHGGRVSVRQLMQACRQYRKSAAMAHAALDQLVDTGYGRWVLSERGRRGRPTEMFEFTKTPGNNGNGNKTHATDVGIQPQPKESIAGYDDPLPGVGVEKGGNGNGDSVTGEEEFPF